MALTYDPIQSYTLGSTQPTVTFSSIPQTYTDLIIVIKYSANSGNSASGIRYNGDTSTIYSNLTLNGTGSGALTTEKAATQPIGYFSYNITTSGASGIDTLSIINIGNYSSSSVTKTALATTQTQTSTYPGVAKELIFWNSTAAITSILLAARAGDFQVGSTFSLYGIKAA